MDAAYFRTLFDYGYWARDKLLLACEGLSEEEYARPNGFTYGSLRGILTHCLDGEYGWRCKLDGESDAGSLTASDLPTLASLQTRWMEEEAKLRAYLAGVSDADLRQRRVASRGAELPLWQVLAHVTNHSTQHRSEAAEALTMIGRSPGDLDLMRFLAEQAS